MPAFRAAETIADSVASVLAQTYANWELFVVADDTADYEKVLAKGGITDPRIRHLSTGKTASGEAAARNLALEASSERFLVLLDADDRFAPKRLEKMAAGLDRKAIVSTALCRVAADGRVLRTVAEGDNRKLGAHEYKQVNISGDSIIAWDRHNHDPRYDITLPGLADLDFLMLLFQHHTAAFHIGEPLYFYLSWPASASNAPGYTARMAQAKATLLNRLENGKYTFANPQAASGFKAFLKTSLQAELSYENAALSQPDLLFEDHLAALLRRSRLQN